ncbi:cytochrome P450 3A8-like [Liolophura sinensis]|uniref:cytochrome P450 3A8-like n=1 Tax=Liolophura sinensis TaxID=3198878 RepID=UPI0031596B6F
MSDLPHSGYFQENYAVFKRLKIRGPKPSLLFGNSLEFKSKFVLDVFSNWYKHYGKVYGFYEGLRPSLVVSDPELIKQILGNDFSKFQDRTECVPFLYWPDNINVVNATGSQWKRERAVVASSFNATSLPEMVGEVASVADGMTSLLMAHINKPVDIANWCDRYAVDSFARAAFGFPVNSLENEEDLLLRFMRANFQQGDIENALTGLARLFPSLVPILKKFNGDYERLHHQHLSNVQTLIKEFKTQFMMGKLTKKNLMTNLLEAYNVYRDEENNDCKRGLSDEELLSQVHGLIGAGFGQTNNLLAFAVYNIAKYPDVQKNVFQEVDRMVPKEDTMNYDSLGHLEYLDTVLHETLRVFPIAPGVTRVCTESCVINDVTIPKGMVIRLMSSPIYSDPEIYPEPEKFDPERFTASEKAKRHPQTFLGVGYGPRMCLGWRLGMIQCKAAIARLVQNFHIELAQEGPLNTTLRPVLSPKDGVWITLKPR